MRIGSRGSDLALAQSGHVRARLPGGNTAHSIEVIETSGDRNPQASLRRIGGQGIFTKEIEVALLEGRIDLAVHSLKDLPTEETPGLEIGALLQREDPRDALVARGGLGLERLVSGARVGTSSLRRRSQLLACRPDLKIEEIRGNVPTRIGQVADGHLDAVVVAMAGLRRLGLLARVTEPIDESIMLPAPGQGILAIQIRRGDDRARKALRPLQDPAAAAEGAAERSLLEELGGGCLVPVGARAVSRGETLSLAGFVGHPDGRPSLRLSAEGRVEEAVDLGRRLAGALLAKGAREILDTVRSDEVFP